MLKRIMLCLTFVAAFSFVGVSTPDTSEARWFGRRPIVRRWYAPRRYYYDRSYYYGPRYDTYYDGGPGYYGYPGDYYGGPRGGVYFSWGY